MFHTCLASVHTHRKNKTKLNGASEHWKLSSLPLCRNAVDTCVYVSFQGFKLTVYLFIWCPFSVMSDSSPLDILLGDLSCAAPLKVDCVIESMRAFTDHTNFARLLHVYTHASHRLCVCIMFFWLSGLFAAVQRVLECKHIVFKNTCVTTISRGRKANVIWNIRGLLNLLSQ